VVIGVRAEGGEMMESQAKYEVTTNAISIDDVKKFIAPNASDKELYMFMNIAKSYDLNPFKREIHFVKYGNNPGSVVVGYEIYLKRAEATGLLDGWNVIIIDKGKPEERAQITIHRKDHGHPFIWECSRKEFNKGQSTWNIMPDFMLKKVCIGQGFRLDFPETNSGLPYLMEEINGEGSEGLPLNHAETSPPEPPEAKPQKAKTLFENLMAARGTFCHMVLDNKDAIQDFLPDEYRAVQERWAKASAQGIGGVTKGAPWPIPETKEEKPLFEIDEGGKKDQFLIDAENYREELTPAAWEGILKLYTMTDKPLSEIQPGYKDAFLARCKGQLELQNSKKA
jgi:phage recombination protein Bet